MDIGLARTFVAIVESGSFKGAASRLNVTQSTISLRVKALEDLLGRPLFERSKAGTRLTPAGVQFQRHATTLMRVWTHAQLDIGLPAGHSDHLAVGGQPSLWEGFLLPWVAWLRHHQQQIAVTASMGTSSALMERLGEGTLDLVVAYRVQARPGVRVEHLMDEELVLVSGAEQEPRGPDGTYVFVNWGPEFAADHAEAFPDLATTGLSFDLGALAVGYLVDTGTSGYFPARIARHYLADGRLRLATRARRFVYPVYAAYPDDHDAEAYAPILDALRRAADRVAAAK